MTVTKYKYIPLSQSYYRPDRFEVYKGLPNLKCRYCGKCSPIPFDMEVHLYDHMKWEFWPYSITSEMEMNDDIFDSEIESMRPEAIASRRYFGFEEE
jgi:hypothetical protein